MSMFSSPDMELFPPGHDASRRMRRWRRFRREMVRGLRRPPRRRVRMRRSPSELRLPLDGSASDLPSGAPHHALQGVRSNQSKGQLWLIIFNEFSVRKW